MTRQLSHRRSLVVLTAAGGGTAALVGSYWDDAWHTDRGRDTFLAAPHVVLYGGVIVALLAVATGLRRPWSRAQRLAVVGGAAVVASGPVDEAWHRAFVRDAVLWSPPHMLAITASLALAAGVLALAVPTRGPVGKAAQLLAAAAVIGTMQMPVLEFDSDVPQFAVWTYIPVATVGWLFTMTIVRRMLPGGWTLTATTAVYTAARFGIVLLLAGLDHSGTIVPPVVALALLDDLLTKRHWPERARIGVQAVIAPITWFVWLAIAGGAATVVPPSAMPIALGATLAGAVVVGVILGPASTRNAAIVSTAVVLAVGMMLVVRPSTVAAHDPGQGTESAPAVMELRRNGDSIDVTLTVQQDRCTDFAAGRTVARRAGQTTAGDLRPDGVCRWRGTVEAPDEGRVFVYVELDQDGRRTELWVPLAGDETVAAIERPLYFRSAGPTGPAKYSAGVTLYAATVGLLVATARMSGRLIGPRS